MPVFRLQVSVQQDTMLPRDAIVITPHFAKLALPTTDADALCNDLATAMQTYLGAPARQISVKAYDAQGTPPVYPIGSALKDANASGASNSMREVALCLSFYGDRNVPRKRGRLYIPAAWLGGGIGLRPTNTQQTKCAALVPIFTGLGGVDVDWSIYSRVANQAYDVENWYVDDEWDIQRRRGTRPTSRISGTTTEAP